MMIVNDDDQLMDIERLCEDEIDWEDAMGLQVNVYEGEGLRTHG